MHKTKGKQRQHSIKRKKSANKSRSLIARWLSVIKYRVPPRNAQANIKSLKPLWDTPEEKKNRHAAAISQ